MDTALNISIDSESVERSVVDAIVNGAIGTHITEAVDKALQPARFGGKSLIETAIEAEIDRAVKQVVLHEIQREPAATQIREAISAHLTDDAVRTITGKAVMRMLDLPE